LVMCWQHFMGIRLENIIHIYIHIHIYKYIYTYVEYLHRWRMSLGENRVEYGESKEQVRINNYCTHDSGLSGWCGMDDDCCADHGSELVHFLHQISPTYTPDWYPSLYSHRGVDRLWTFQSKTRIYGNIFEFPRFYLLQDFRIIIHIYIIYIYL
jgi:hypothetical protein